MIICLNTRNRLLGFRELYRGTINTCQLEPREFFKTALAMDAASFIVAHNHPSGDPAPSREDREFTRKIVAAGEIVGIRCVDHVVVGDEGGGAVSFKDAGLM